MKRVGRSDLRSFWFCREIKLKGGRHCLTKSLCPVWADGKGIEPERLNGSKPEPRDRRRKCGSTCLQWTITQASGLKPLMEFERRLTRRINGILSHCRWPLNTSVLEGMNNKIKVLKRIAYGYRDEAYFFLKIRAAFPGIP